MNSVSRPATVRLPDDSISDPAAAFSLALDLFGAAELSEFLPSPHHPDYLRILSELVRVELMQSWQVGAPISLETFQERYPQLFERPDLVLPVALEEFNRRHQAGDSPSMVEYCTRFDLARDDWPTLRFNPGSGPLALSPLDPDVSSKLDIQLPKDAGDNASRTRRRRGGDLSMTEIVPTRLAFPGPRRDGAAMPSDPEIVWKLDEKMLAMPNVGDEFLGFSLLAELGKGAFGKVFLAQQGELAGRFVALKVAAGLFSESQTLAQLQHTHIVPIYSYHHSPIFQAVCMPYLGCTTLAHILADIRTQQQMPSSGKDLLSTLNFRRRSTRWHEEADADSLSSTNPGDPRDRCVAAPAKTATRASTTLELEGMSYVDSILWLAVRLADGLAHAHERGILHRDLKPANILLTDDGLPMLLDFNLAQDTKQHDSAAAASIGGTLPYMAPEHLEAFRGNAGVVDARSDLYSLGVILFELLTGAAPFPSYRKLSTRETVSRMIHDRQEKLPRLRTLNPSIPPAVEAIVLRCMEPEPAKRYASARDLQEDLQRQLDHEPLKHAPNPSLWERVQKFRKRHPRLTSATSVAGAALALFVGMASAAFIREEQYARLDAREALVRFEDDAETTRFLLHARTAPSQLDEGQQAARAALEHFQVLDNPAWRDGPAVRRLPEAERRRLEEEVGQLLVLLAHTHQLEGDRTQDDETRRQNLEEGLHLCTLASSCFPAEQSPRALWKQKGELQRRLGESDQARQSFERADKAELRTVYDLYLTARQLAEEGKFRAALPIIRKALAHDPRDYNLNFLEGICHDYLAQHNDALACYRACIALKPRFYGAYYNRGLTYLRQGNFRAATADFDRVIDLRADFVDVYVQRALALQRLEKYADAVEDLTTALNLGVGETRVYFLRARMREKLKDLDGAKKDLAEGLRRTPADEASWITRGIAQLPGNPNQAMRDFDEALRINPRSLAALQNKAHVLGKYFQRSADSVKVLDRAVELYPDDCRPRAGRGVYLARQGKRDAALKDAEAALLLDTTPPNLYLVAGIYALTSKQQPDDRREAMNLLTKALKSGFGYGYLDIDRDLDPLRELPTFRRVIEASRVLAAPESTRK